ncbi:MAG: hypothetical protein HY931_04720 [Candidatus Falkowbacteria bacterium]|nr:MAG: hypothetical protein HY931_04720 [Candidatus Falkowbacteria bacterium]
MAKNNIQEVVAAIIDCFYEAHCAATEIEGNELDLKQYCLSLVKGKFQEQGVDFNNPTKEGILKVINALAAFSKDFRSQEVIDKHKSEIIVLLNKVE